jgi:hypothetical protein
MEQNKQPNFAPSIEVEALTNFFSSAEVGDHFDYEQLNGVVGLDLRVKPYLLASARKKVERDFGIVILADPGRGVYRATDDQIVGEGTKALDANRRKARRAMKRSALADRSNLSPDRQTIRDLNMTILAIHRRSAEGRFRKALSARVSTQGVLPPAKTVEYFQNGEEK